MKRKIIKKMGAIVCALAVVVGCMGTVPCYADTSSVSWENVLLENQSLFYYSGDGSNVVLPDVGASYWALFWNSFHSCYIYMYSDEPLSIRCSTEVSGKYYTYYFYYADNVKNPHYRSSDGVTWSYEESGNVPTYAQTLRFNGETYSYAGNNNLWLIACNSPIIGALTGQEVLSRVNENFDKVDASLGYLKGLSYDIAYEMGALYNYDEKSRTDRFTFDKLTTTDLDLTSGNYSIRHYIRPVLCNGYEDENIIEKGEKYLMGEYDASSLEFRYKRADYETKLEEYGYDGLDFFDSLLGRFYLEWHYFQIVNNDTGEVGNYVVMRPKNADENEFGTERVAYTVDENDEVDTENGYEETIVDTDMAGGETIDEAFENGEEEDLDFGDLDGIDEFTKALKSFTKSIGKVSNAFGKLLGALPQWVVNVLGVSIGLSVLLFLIKVLRG